MQRLCQAFRIAQVGIRLPCSTRAANPFWPSHGAPDAPDPAHQMGACCSLQSGEVPHVAVVPKIQPVHATGSQLRSVSRLHRFLGCAFVIREVGAEASGQWSHRGKQGPGNLPGKPRLFPRWQTRPSWDFTRSWALCGFSVSRFSVPDPLARPA